MPAHVLVVDDEDQIRSILATYLRADGYDVLEAATGAEGLALAMRNDVALVLLDIGLPDIDGLEVLRQLRQSSDVYVVLVTARTEEIDRIVGLEVGADDYVTKPFSMKELLARIAALLRRGGVDGEEDVYEDARIRVDRSRHTVEREGRQIRLTKKEFDLLWLLVKSGGRVVTRESILSRLWDYAADVETRTVDVHIRSLRKKAGDDLVETVVGVGYRFAR